MVGWDMGVIGCRLPACPMHTLSFSPLPPFPFHSYILCMFGTACSTFIMKTKQERDLSVSSLYACRHCLLLSHPSSISTIPSWHGLVLGWFQTYARQCMAQVKQAGFCGLCAACGSGLHMDALYFQRNRTGDGTGTNPTPRILLTILTCILPYSYPTLPTYLRLSPPGQTCRHVEQNRTRNKHG